MKKLLLAALFLVAVTAFPQNTDSLHTKNFANGRYWAEMNQGEKLRWIEGYEDGVQFAAAGHKDIQFEAVSCFPAGILTFGEVITSVDRFYSGTPENGPIPISQALCVTTMRARGVQEAEINKLISQFRAASTTR
jgi:hypothetical protein